MCSPWSVCNKVDTYDTPRVERQCRCPSGQTCSASLTSSDGHTITDKNRQFKVGLLNLKTISCQPKLLRNPDQ